MDRDCGGWRECGGGNNRSLIFQKTLNMQRPKSKKGAFGDGHAGERILHTLENTIPVRQLTKSR